ncbi:MAG: alanine dehydrogenase [Pseudohongiellaceae bacterium]|uniref:Alanine dehydrogenase n=1 Tax=OM182 bacterium MED-G28 TaxID=1986256 RepID=A0A2A5W7S5_9GAMM|nr:MAG: alanine dehydrogenase [OM182 bacterium MED-G28]
MRIGVPKEIKIHEYRVGLIPAAVREITQAGHKVFLESNAGIGSGFDNASYVIAGATILETAEEIFGEAEMIVKVKEPLASERKLLRSDLTLFAYLHLAPDLEQTEDLVQSNATCIAYETVTDARGQLPLLAPMSEVAGRMSVQAGAVCLEKSHGGAGLLLGGVPGVESANVLILGGGVVGSNALKMAVGMEANVTVIDKSLDTLRDLDEKYANRIQTIYSTQEAIETCALNADLIIGAVLIPGAASPKLVGTDLIKRLKPGSVVVDVAIDQGGCFETSKATTHDNPTYLVHDVVHYCVANMPGAVAKTSAIALNNATLPFVLQLANQGTVKALQSNSHLFEGLNVWKGRVINEHIAQQHGYEFNTIGPGQLSVGTH